MAYFEIRNVKLKRFFFLRGEIGMIIRDETFKNFKIGRKESLSVRGVFTAEGRVYSFRSEGILHHWGLFFREITQITQNRTYKIKPHSFENSNRKYKSGSTLIKGLFRMVYRLL